MSDGYHIALLIMAALHYLAPKFIEEGRLCWLHSPLYIVNDGKKESYYFTDAEFNKARPTLRGEVTRAKGIGELSADMAHRAMFTEEFQRMEPLIPTIAAIEMLERLMGESVEPRREYVFNKIDFSNVRE